MFSVTPELYSTVSLVARWLFAFFALMLLLFAFSWHHSERKEQRERFRNLPGAGTVGELLVLSGSDELPQDTWFPVPREGILGSLRSCDLVSPCPGVRSQHLDFSWQDRTGLLVRPRLGCDIVVDGVLVDRREAADGVPLLHGSVLQVGSAVLRLQLFAALSHTNRTFSPAVPMQPASPAAAAWTPQPQPQPMQPQPAQPQPMPVSYPPSCFPAPPAPPGPQQDFILPEDAVRAAAADPEPPLQEAPRRKRADRWKEDWSE